MLIKPDDIADLGKSNENFLLKIRQWKIGLTRIIGSKVLNEFGLYTDSIGSKLGQFGIKLVTFITESIPKLKENIVLEPSQEKIVENFLKTKK